MEITASNIDTGKGQADWFTGDVYVDPIASPSGPSRAGAGLVHFTPGARTHWHTHPYGQTIYVTEGIGRCQRDGSPIEEMRPGDRVVLRARREPLARRRAQPVHGPHRHPTSR